MYMTFESYNWTGVRKTLAVARAVVRKRCSCEKDRLLRRHLDGKVKMLSGGVVPCSASTSPRCRSQKPDRDPESSESPERSVSRGLHRKRLSAA